MASFVAEIRSAQESFCDFEFFLEPAPRNWRLLVLRGVKPEIVDAA